MLAGLFSYPKRHFYLSENDRRYIPRFTKIRGKKYSSFSSQASIVGDINRSSEQVFSETVRWVPLLLKRFNKLSDQFNSFFHYGALLYFFLNRNVKGSQEVVDFVADRLREQRKNNELNLAKICEEVNMSINLGEIISIIVIITRSTLLG